MVNKRVRTAVLGCNLKNDRKISIYFQGKPFNITVIQVYAQPLIWRRWSWRPTRPSRTKTQNRCPFHHRGLECKSRKSRDTWSNRQIWPSSTKQSRAKANRDLSKEGTGQSKHPLPTTQEKTLHMDITRWWILKSVWLIIFFAAKDGDALYNQQKQDRELTMAQIMNSLLPNSDLNWRKYGKPLDHSGMT